MELKARAVWDIKIEKTAKEKKTRFYKYTQERERKIFHFVVSGRSFMSGRDFGTELSLSHILVGRCGSFLVPCSYT